MDFNRKQKIILTAISLALGCCIVLTTFIFNEVLYKALLYIFYGFGSLFLIVGLLFLYSLISKTLVGKTLNTKQIATISIQSAISVLLYLFVKFPLPIFPSFLDIHVSEIPALISSFMYGPYVGSIIIFVRFLFKLPTTITAGVGELADLIIGLALVITSSVIYRKNRTLKGAVISMGCGIGVATLVACLVNYFILIPAYLNLTNLSIEGLVQLCIMIPGINQSNYLIMYVLGGALPFNAFRFILVFVLTFVLYKKVSRVIHKLTVN